EHRLPVGLVLEVYPFGGGSLGRLHRQKLNGGDALADGGDEFVVEEKDRIHFADGEARRKVRSDVSGGRVVRVEAGKIPSDWNSPTPKKLEPFAADGRYLELLLRLLLVVDEPRRAAENIRIEAPGEPAVGGEDHHLHLLGRPHGEEWVRDRVCASDYLRDDLIEHLRVRTRRQDRILGFAEFRRRNHLHRLGDLLGIAHRTDALA